MVDQNSVNAQPISECAVKRLKGMCAVSFFAGFDAYINCFGKICIYILLNCEGMFHFMIINLCEFLRELCETRFYYVHYFKCKISQVLYFLSY